MSVEERSCVHPDDEAKNDISGPVNGQAKQSDKPECKDRNEKETEEQDRHFSGRVASAKPQRKWRRPTWKSVTGGCPNPIGPVWCSETQRSDFVSRAQDYQSRARMH